MAVQPGLSKCVLFSGTLFVSRGRNSIKKVNGSVGVMKGNEYFQNQGTKLCKQGHNHCNQGTMIKKLCNEFAFSAQGRAGVARAIKGFSPLPSEV